MKTENYRVEQKEIEGARVSVTTYQIGARFHCHIANVDPGATIARAEADSPAEAEHEALAKAAERLRKR
jgi:ribosomal protein L16/L10AE